jgi:predicted TIM-barrel fold metal-dependent hydrolase
MKKIELSRPLLPSCVCCAPRLGRRGFLSGAATLSAVAALSANVLAQPAAAAAPHRIDVHHHLSAPAWVTALKKAKLDSPPVNNWTPERSLAEMDRSGIATSILSVTAPAMDFLGAKDSADLARASNEYAKSLTVAHPGRFGFFAVLPMPHQDESLTEVAYALDVLKADGIALLTSYGGNKWLGDEAFRPVMDELNRRQAVVYTHPANPACCVNLAGIPSVIIEYGTDTTRTIASLIFSGAAAKVPDIKFIFSHAGGTITSLTDRFMAQIVGYPEYKAFTGAGVLSQLQRFYYETAQASNPIAMASLTKMVATSQILFGTDYPYRTAPEQVKALQEIFSADDLKKIERGNAQKLMPRWA